MKIMHNSLHNLYSLPEYEPTLSRQLQYISVNGYLLNQKAGKAKHKRLERHSILLAAILTSLHFEKPTRKLQIRSLIFTECTFYASVPCDAPVVLRGITIREFQIKSQYEQPLILTQSVWRLVPQVYGNV